MTTSHEEKPHDHLFRAMLADPEDVVAALPDDLGDALEPGSLAPAPPSLLGDDLKELVPDLAFTARLRTGEDAVVLLFEHLSAPDPWLTLRLADAVVRLGQRARRDGARRIPLVLPVVVFQGPGPWSGPRSLADLAGASDPARDRLGTSFLSLDPKFLELGPHSREELLARRGSARARVALVLLGAERRGEDLLLVVSACRDPLRQVNEHDLVLFARYIRVTRDVSAADARRTFEAAVGGRAGEAVMTSYLRELAESEARGKAEGKAEGEAKGKAEGEAKGKAEGKAEGAERLRGVLRSILRSRFGTVSPAAEALIARAELDDLACLAERALVAATAGEVFAPPAPGA